MSRPRAPLLSLFVLLACGGDGGAKGGGGGATDGAGDGGDDGDDGGAPVEPAPVCPAASGAGDVAMGDANWDGETDIADGVWTLRSLLDGGATYACEDAQDFIRDDLIDIADALAIFYALFTDQAKVPTRSPSCATPTAIPEAPCGVLVLSVDAEPQVNGPAGQPLPFTVGVQLQSPSLEVQAWSYGLSAVGCSVSSFEEAGSVVADHRLDPEGHRDDGFVRTDVIPGGVTGAAVLSWKRDVTLAAQGDPWRVLNVGVEATVPASGCSSCTLTFSDTLAGGGAPVALVVSAGGRSYRPDTTPSVIQICAD